MCSLHLTHPSTHTWSSGQPSLRRPGSSWGFGALLKGFTSVVDTSCRSQDSNSQPRITSPTLHPLGLDCPRNLTIHCPNHPPFNTVQSSFPLCRKAPLKHDVSTPMLHGWNGVLGIVLILLLPPNKASGVYTKKFYFGLIWPGDLLPCLLWIIRMVFGKLQTGLDMCWLEQGDLVHAAGFYSMTV